MSKHLTLFLVILSVLGVTGCTKTEDYIVGILKERSELIDPGSVQFRKIMRGAGGGSTLWCGELKAKNRMGVYTDWQRFAFHTQSGYSAGVTIISRDMESLWTKDWPGICDRNRLNDAPQSLFPWQK